MSAQSVSIAAMFGWVVDSFKLFGKNFRSLMSASFLTLVLAVLMMVPMGIVVAISMASMQSGGVPVGAMPMAGNMTLFITVYAITVAMSLLMFPPILVGWLRLCQNLDHKNAVSGFDILKPYKDKQLWLRSIGFALLAMVIYLAVLGLFVLAFSGVISEFTQQVQAQQLAALSGSAPPPPSFPLGFLLAYFGFLGVAIFLQFVYMLGFSEISLRPTAPIQAMKQAAIGVLKNAFKLILFLICTTIIFYIALSIIGLILGLIVVVFSFIHPAAGAIVAAALFFPFLLCIYPPMFAGHYFMWKSIMGAHGPVLANTYDSTLSV